MFIHRFWQNLLQFLKNLLIFELDLRSEDMVRRRVPTLGMNRQ